MEWHGAQTGAPAASPVGGTPSSKPVILSPSESTGHPARAGIVGGARRPGLRQNPQARHRRDARVARCRRARRPHSGEPASAPLWATCPETPSGCLQVHVRLHGAEKLVRADAMASAVVNASAICRRIVAAAYHQQTGATLPSCAALVDGGRPVRRGRAADVQRGHAAVVGRGHRRALPRRRDEWVRDAVLRHYRVDESPRRRRETCQSDSRENCPSWSQSKDQSIWPSGLSAQDVRVSIIGRPYVNRTARDERAEGGGMKLADAKPGTFLKDSDGGVYCVARKRPFALHDPADMASSDHSSLAADPFAIEYVGSSALHPPRPRTGDAMKPVQGHHDGGAHTSFLCEARRGPPGLLPPVLRTGRRRVAAMKARSAERHESRWSIGGEKCFSRPKSSTPPRWSARRWACDHRPPRTDARAPSSKRARINPRPPAGTWAPVKSAGSGTR